jgi:signal transduction histidine kinase
VNISPVPASTQSLAELVGTGLGRLEGLSKKTLLTLATILFFTDLGYEGQRNPGVFPGLIVYSLVSVLLFIIFFTLPFPILRKFGNSTTRAFGVIFVTMLAASAKSLLLMLLVHGESFLANFLERIAGDLSIAVLYVVVVATIFQAYSNHLQVVEELNRVSVRLAEQKTTTIQVASEVEAELQERANSSLGAELDRIASASQDVLDSVETASLKMQIQALVRNQVRPLSRELHARVQVLKATAVPQLTKPRASELFSLRIIPKIDSSFIASYVVATPNIFFTIASKAGIANALLVLLVSLSYPVLGRLIQFVLPTKRTPISYTLTIPAVISIAAYLPTGIVIYLLSLSYPLVGLTTYSSAGVLIFTCISSTAWFALERTRAENAANISQLNSEIRHELDLLDQAVWVAQRKWSYIIHGTVQGALTVASSRLEMAGKPDEKLKLAVRADIERAKSVLVSPPSFDRPVTELLKEISDTWQGVCDFEYQISPSAETALAKSATSTTCLIEIAKELISNANRHGKATKFWLNAYLSQDRDLEIVCANNGEASDFSGSTGLGYEMISQLTRNWTLSGDRNTVFKATLPLPRENATLLS